MKREQFLAALLAATMVCGPAPLSAMAADTGTATEVESVETEAETKEETSDNVQESSGDENSAEDAAVADESAAESAEKAAETESTEDAAVTDDSVEETTEETAATEEIASTEEATEKIASTEETTEEIASTEETSEEVEDDAEKKFATAGWYQQYGSWYYRNADGSNATGWKQIGKTWYYLNPNYNGMMNSDETAEINGKLYHFSSSGAMTTGWSKSSGTYDTAWYYSNSSGVVLTGWQKINGTWYYFDPDYGYMYHGGYKIGNTTYLFSSSGAWIGKTNNGWKYISQGNDEGRYYYVENNKVVTGWKRIGGTWYYFDPEYGGYMYEDQISEINGAYYAFNKSGAMVTGGWYEGYNYYDDDYGWYYVTGSSGKCATGWKKINGKWYYFDPESAYMYSSNCSEIDGKYYIFNSSGAWVTAKNGWVYDGYKWYYLDSDEQPLSGWQTIGGKKYYFDTDSHVMYTGYHEIDDEEYVFDSSGALVDGKSGWVHGDEYWYYLDSDGEPVNGWQTIGGKRYYFDTSSYEMYTGRHEIDDEEYVFDSNGALVDKANTWVWDGYSYYYLGEDKKPVRGWLKLGSTWYYLDPEMCTGYHTINGTEYVFNSSGAWVNKANTWVRDADGNYYYLGSNKKAVVGWKKIGGKWYYFNRYNRVMYANGSYTINGKVYRFNKSGACLNP